MKKIKALGPGAIAALLVVVLVLVAAYWTFFRGSGGTRTISADFPRTVSVYNGSDVRIFGVSIGKVESVTPMGQFVRVKVSYDDQYKVPADATAVIISPSVVGDRFVQLTWKKKDHSADRLADGAVLGCGTSCGQSGATRTAVPLELDEIFGSINQLDIALGPKGANAPNSSGEGALTRLLDSTARNFGGQGAKFNETIRNLSRLTKTLDTNKDQFFGAQKNIEMFVQALAKNDQTVRDFNTSLAAGATVLAGERNDLAAAMDNLSTALEAVRSYVQENKTLLKSNITGLARITDTLVKRRNELAEILSTAPLALNNLNLAGNRTPGTLDTRTNLGQSFDQLQSNPKAVLCGLLSATTGGPCPLPRVTFGEVKQAQEKVRQRVDPTLAGLVAR